MAQPSLQLDATYGTSAVRAGRRFVAERIAALGATSMANDAALVTGELVANALQHGHPPVSVTVKGAGAHRDHDDDVTALVLQRIPSGG